MHLEQARAWFGRPLWVVIGLRLVCSVMTVDPADLERLVRARLHTDRNEVHQIHGCWLRWWAVRSDDQAAVMASIGLHDLRPVSYDIAESVLETIEHCREAQPLVYVSPAAGGWTTVTGPWCDVFHELPDHPGRPAEARATVERLSAEFGEAHAFYSGERDGGSRWLVARDGVTVRTYDVNDWDGCTGAPLEFEPEMTGESGLRPDDEDYEPPYAPAIGVALELSDVPRWLVPADPRHGLPGIATLPGFTGSAPLPPDTYTG
jgi:hypothetical protein